MSPCRVHVVFGQVIKGEEVVREVENQPTDDNSCPLQPVVIANCGELVLKRKQKGDSPLCLFSQSHTTST